MNSNHTFLAMLLSIIESVRAGNNPNKFYSTFGNIAYYYQNDFSNRSSFLKLRECLQLTGVARDDSGRIILNSDDTTIHHQNLKYQLYTSGDITQLSKTEKLCHLKVYEIEELRNIFIANSEQPVNLISWKCPLNAWCCGAECCQYYFKNPWPLLGPNLYELIVSMVVFGALLVIFELYRRLPKRKIDNKSVLAISQETSRHITESSEDIHFIM